MVVPGKQEAGAGRDQHLSDGRGDEAIGNLEVAVALDPDHENREGDQVAWEDGITLAFHRECWVEVTAMEKSLGELERRLEG